ncbi:MAG TPA: SRPBCC domain-containing protein [Acidimicrobiales bacterium]|nr:SRPBCC domain-containing protein [Acidimicrobiales bacterium]
MTPHANGSTSVEFPNNLEIVATRDFDAPIELVFDVITKPEHIVNWFPAFEDTMTVCTVDLRVGGAYHFVCVTKEGVECSFRGTYLELTPPTRLVDTWQFEGWPGVEAFETVELTEVNGVTKMTNTLAFRDQAGRDHMTKTDGFEDSFNKMGAYVASLVESTQGDA